VDTVRCPGDIGGGATMVPVPALLVADPVLLQSSNRSIYYAKLEVESRCVPESVTL